MNELTTKFDFLQRKSKTLVTPTITAKQLCVSIALSTLQLTPPTPLAPMNEAFIKT